VPESADDDLITQSRRGSREAFEELIRRSARLVFARIYLETGDPHRTEDLVQETFLIAWRSIGRLTDSNSFRPWLLSIAHSVVIDDARKRNRKKRSANEIGQSAMMRLANDNPTPLESAANKEQREQMLSVLRSLPREYRDVLMLRYLAGADYESISRQLALSNGSLRGLLSRGLAMLRRELNCFDDSEKKS